MFSPRVVGYFPDRQYYRFCCAKALGTTPDSIQNGITPLAQTVEEHAPPFIHGTTEAFGTACNSPCSGNFFSRIAVAYRSADGRADDCAGHGTDGNFLSCIDLALLCPAVCEILLILSHGLPLCIDDGRCGTGADDEANEQNERTGHGASSAWLTK